MKHLLLATATALMLLVPFGVSQNVLTPVGQVVPNFKLLTILRGDGRATLNEYRGQPVLIAQYSTNVAGMNSARDASKLAEKFATKGLVTLFMELDGRDTTGMLALALHHESEYGGRLLKAQNLPIPFEWDDGPPPGMALIGIDGTLLASGTYQMSPKIEKMIAGELKKRKRGWGTHAAAIQARALAFGANDFGLARKTVYAALEAEPGQVELLALYNEFEARFASFSRSVDFLIEQGEIKRALERAKDLAESVKNDADWATATADILARFTEEPLVKAIAEDKTLAGLIKKVTKKGPKKGQTKKLRAFTEKAQDARVVARAIRYIEAIEFALNNNLSTK